jgi:serpin B
MLETILARMEMQDAIVYFPRFKFDSSFELARTLEQMGMVLAFDPDQADFNGMAATDELYISRVVHKATVDVDEAGTEAAAATAVIAAAGAAPDQPEPVVFRADRPFLFLIREDSTGTILFLGRVMQPKE